MTTFQGGVTFVAASIGGGFVALPFAFLHLGIPVSLISLLCISCLTWFSCRLYLRVRELVGDQFQSYYELGYMLFGRKAIYYIGFNFAFLGWSILVIYYIILGDLCKSLMNKKEGMWSNKWPFIVIFGILLMKELLRKDIRYAKI